MARKIIKVLARMGQTAAYNLVDHRPPDYYFVMGDNRDNSKDSRYIGCIPRGKIVGQAKAVVLSLDPGNHYLPRWGRFFSALP